MNTDNRETDLNIPLVIHPPPAPLALSTMTWYAPSVASICDGPAADEAENVRYGGITY